MKKLSHERLLELLDYDLLSGVFTWKVNRGGVHPGDTAGTAHIGGYLAVCLDYKRYLLHRLAIFYVTSKWPADEVDHIDGDRSNNAWVNLREATRCQNSYNHKKRVDNSSGVRGVSFRTDKGLWRASIQKDNKAIHIGYFPTIELAISARIDAAKLLFGEFASEVCR